MALETFKPQFRDRASDYRTPSPPPVEFFASHHPSFGTSPTSPLWTESKARHNIPRGHQSQYAHYEGDEQDFRRSTEWPKEFHQDSSAHNKHSLVSALDSPSRLDIFAAVATSPRIEDLPSRGVEPSSETIHWNYIDKHGQSARNHSLNLGERPPKRIRIEQSAFSEQILTHSDHLYDRGIESTFLQDEKATDTLTPKLSDQSLNCFVRDSKKQLDTSIEDAELLLSFAQSSIHKNPQLFYPPDQNTFPLTQFHTSTVNFANGKELGIGAQQRQTSINNTLSRHDSSIYETTSSNHPLELKRRVHKGWPKGKPRGTRQATSKTKIGKGRKVKAPASKSSKNIALVSVTAEAAQHESDATAEFIAQIKKASKRRLSAPEVFYGADRISVGNRQLSAPPDIDERALNVNLLARPSGTNYGKSSSKTPLEPVNICAACNSSKSAVNGYKNLWIGCDGCKRWFHYVCAGFRNQREVRDIDKFYCKECEALHGPTTTVRKSSRAHTALDYAGLNEGVIRTSDDVLEHHFIKSIKTGAFQFDPETFPRMAPELVTAEYFEASGGMAEPILIPASLNPQPSDPDSSEEFQPPIADQEEWFSSDYEYDCVPDDGQDKLDMVIPRGLTVRQVANICGPEQKIDVIDVKNQTGEDKRWNLRQWADYYEAEGDKPVRNVISLEFSWSKLSKLVRRPKIARDLDLQDMVWPSQEHMKGNSPKSVQYYCLMSVADCYTDFHIDFGGSSVYYHILKGKKTFFFIPPKSKHLKKYEEWCNSKDQNNTWLPDLTQECYRVDLSVGDTMIIPSGWIHSVWTPENSLVIGGNFLTRMHYAMQIRINEIEKATKTALKFRYPMFQRVMWFAVIDYLKTDPIPSTIIELFYSGAVFPRPQPIWYDDDIDESLWDSEPGHFNARFYSQAEIEGLAALRDYVLRTVKISLGKIDGVTKETQGAVIRSMPKGYGDHIDLLKTFAIWVAWKKGNELLPSWAFPDAVFPENTTSATEKILSASAQRKRERQVAHDAWLASSDRPSRRSTLDKKEALEGATLSDNNITDGHSKEEIAEGSRRPHEDASIIKEGLGIRIILKANVTENADEGIDILDESNNEYETNNFNSPSNFPRSTLVAVVIDSKPRDRVEVDMEDTLTGAKPHLAMHAATTASSMPVHGEIPATTSKPSRAKACDDCRRSKRRCIHDENGQIDASKISETPTRRGPNKNKASKADVNILTTANSPSAPEIPIGEIENSAVAPIGEQLVKDSTSLDASMIVDGENLSATVEWPSQTPPPIADVNCSSEAVTLRNSDVVPDNSSFKTLLIEDTNIDEDENILAESVEPIGAQETALSGKGYANIPDDVVCSTQVASTSVHVPSLDREFEHVNSNSNSISETKSRTSSPRLHTNSTERTSSSRSRSSSPLTDVEPTSSQRQESPDELSIKVETATKSGFAPRTVEREKRGIQEESSKRRNGLRHVSTRASSFSTTKSARVRKQKNTTKSSRPKTPSRTQAHSPDGVPITNPKKARSASATSENEDWKLALKLAAEDRGLRRRG